MIAIINSSPFECFIIFFWQATSKEMIHHCVLLIVFIILSMMRSSYTFWQDNERVFNIPNKFCYFTTNVKSNQQMCQNRKYKWGILSCCIMKFMKIFLNMMLIMYTINTWIFWPAFISFLMVCHLGWCVGNFIYVHFTFVACIE